MVPPRRRGSSGDAGGLDDPTLVGDADAFFDALGGPVSGQLHWPWHGRVLSKARLRSAMQNSVRSLRSRTCQHTAPDLAASVISRTNAIRIASSLSGIRGLWEV